MNRAAYKPLNITPISREEARTRAYVARQKAARKQTALTILALPLIIIAALGTIGAGLFMIAVLLGGKIAGIVMFVFGVVDIFHNGFNGWALFWMALGLFLFFAIKIKFSFNR